MPEPCEYIQEKIKQIYGIVQELEAAYPGRHFTPDGHLVGSMGEVVAAERYGLTLLTAGAETHDAISRTGQLVQIKATQGKTISVSSCPQYLLVMKITEDGQFLEVYNGPGDSVWSYVGSVQKNGQCKISPAKLAELNATVEDRIQIG